MTNRYWQGITKCTVNAFERENRNDRNDALYSKFIVSYVLAAHR